jgi:FMN phosphatase YigB (HAD superfamily)
VIGIRGVIFDLDDTLFDCTGQLTEPARLRASEILASSIPGTTTQHLTSLQTELSTSLGSSGAIQEIGARYSLDSSLVDDALSTYNRDDVPNILPYPDAIDTLDQILSQKRALLLVTTGRTPRQLAKVERLGLSSYFELGRNLYVHEPDDAHPTKEAEVRLALASANLLPEESLSVGDKLDADVRVGNLIGTQTVRIRKGRQRDLEPANPTETPDFDIRELGELLPILHV